VWVFVKEFRGRVDWPLGRRGEGWIDGVMIDVYVHGGERYVDGLGGVTKFAAILTADDVTGRLGRLIGITSNN